MAKQDPPHICTEKETLGQINQSLVGIHGILTDFKKELFGNGTPGLKTQVDRLNEKEKVRDKWDKRLWGVFSTLAAGLVLVGVKVFFF